MYTLDLRELQDALQNNQPVTVILSGEKTIAYLTTFNVDIAQPSISPYPTRAGYPLKEKPPEPFWEHLNLRFTSTRLPPPENS